MVVPNKRRPAKFAAPWHAGFLAMLPTIRNYARGAFAHLNPETQQDLTQEVIVNCLVAYVRLFRQGRISLAYPTVLTQYGIAQVKDGRRVGASLNIKDVLSPYCRMKKKVVVERLDHFDEESEEWREILLEDKTAGPAEIAASRLDFAAWLWSLPRKLRRIAKVLATSETTTEAAKKFGVSAGRISQIRKELHRAWHRFQGDADGGAVPVAA